MKGMKEMAGGGSSGEWIAKAGEWIAKAKEGLASARRASPRRRRAWQEIQAALDRAEGVVGAAARRHR